MNQIKDYIENGIITESFQAQLNLNIWNEIAKHSVDLDKLEETRRNLFVYLQRSAQSAMVLRTARIFDTEKKHPTRCLDGLFKKVRNLDLEGKTIHNPHGLNEYLSYLTCFEKFDPVPQNTSDFLLPFIDYCESELFKIKYQSEIELIKELRDKFITHNEAIQYSKNFDPNIIKTLTNSAINISIIIERCLIIDSIYLVEDSAVRSSYFIKDLIKKELNQ
ncbi:MAG: hypothetical protein EP333_02220 [Bacteroidetes bacterium]|nr:MAG: hypothetical protein EP333_02220 [Bacteroidota bacterium]TNE98651.1 MAG: hypothetical protein EP322_04515 [Bacteroidota bacterium]